jgi:Hint domain-containing protein
MKNKPKARPTWLFIVVMATILAGVGAAALQSPTPTPTPESAKPGNVGRVITGVAEGPVESPPLSELARNPPPQRPPYHPAIEKIAQPELRYRLLDHFGHIHYCDPYMYPVGRSDVQDALTVFPEIRRDPATFAVITQHAGLKGKTEFTDADKQTIYREYRKLRWAVRLERAGSGYKFKLAYYGAPAARSRPGIPGGNGYRVEGTIIPPDKITVLRREPAYLTCPICLARGTRIDTPAGPVAVEDLRPGMLVWTLNAGGARVAAPVERVAAVPVPPGHRVVHLVMRDGRELWVSPGHPTADGRSVGELQAGNSYGAGTPSAADVVIKAETVSYAGEKTYDLLPAGDTGFYWANGILLGSTMKNSN